MILNTIKLTDIMLMGVEREIRRTARRLRNHRGVPAAAAESPIMVKLRRADEIIRAMASPFRQAGIHAIMAVMEFYPLWWKNSCGLWKSTCSRHSFSEEVIHESTIFAGVQGNKYRFH